MQMQISYFCIWEMHRIDLRFDAISTASARGLTARLLWFSASIAYPRPFYGSRSVSGRPLRLSCSSRRVFRGRGRRQRVRGDPSVLFIWTRSLVRFVISQRLELFRRRKGVGRNGRTCVALRVWRKLFLIRVKTVKTSQCNPLFDKRFADTAA